MKQIIEAKTRGNDVDMSTMKIGCQVTTRSQSENPEKSFIQTRSKARSKRGSHSRNTGLLKFNEAALPSDDEDDDEFQPSG